MTFCVKLKARDFIQLYNHDCFSQFFSLSIVYSFTLSHLNRREERCGSAAVFQLSSKPYKTKREAEQKLKCKFQMERQLCLFYREIGISLFEMFLGFHLNFVEKVKLKNSFFCLKNRISIEKEIWTSTQIFNLAFSLIGQQV